MGQKDVGRRDYVTVKNGRALFTYLEAIKMRGELRSKTSRWDEHYKDIYAYLAHGAPLGVISEQASRVIAVMEAVEKSSKSGQAEPVLYE